LELDIALRDHTDYHNAYVKHQMDLIRFIGLLQRNMKVKQSYVIRDPRKFYQFWWEQAQVSVPEKIDWKKLDEKYKSARPRKK